MASDNPLSLLDPTLRAEIRRLGVELMLKVLKSPGLALPIPAAADEVGDFLRQYGADGERDLADVDGCRVSVTGPGPAGGDALSDVFLAVVWGQRSGVPLQRLAEIRLIVERYQPGQTLLLVRWQADRHGAKWAEEYLAGLLTEAATRWPEVEQYILYGPVAPKTGFQAPLAPQAEGQTPSPAGATETAASAAEPAEQRKLGSHGGTMDRVREARELIETGEHKTTACRRAGIDIRTYDRYVLDITCPENGR